MVARLDPSDEATLEWLGRSWGQAMPLYEYFCPTCNQKFELLRSMSRAEETATCPSGHPGANRVLSLFASFSKGEDGSMLPVGGSPCASCATGACSTCGIAN